MSTLSPPREIIEAFHLMWSNFPEPVSLVHKSREVVAVNNGHFLSPGEYCSKTGTGPHVGCLANRALAEKKPIVVGGRSPVEKKEMVSYWIPLDGYPDYFLHLSIRFAIDYEARQFVVSPIDAVALENYSHRWSEENKQDQP